MGFPDIFFAITVFSSLLDIFKIKFENKILKLNGLCARVVQHEFDHIEGILFTDKLSSFKKKILKGKLNNIAKGNIDVDYKMRFPLASKKR